jgi:hypothetical protein
MSSVQEEAYPSLAPKSVAEPEPKDEREPEEAEVGNIDKIREIIFGGQMRDYSKRFATLETRVIKESVELREDTRKRFEVLEMFIKREFEALSDRLQTEQRYREEAVRGIAREIDETGQNIEAKISQLESDSARAHRDLREQILEQSKNLSDEIRERHAEISSALGHEVQNINQDKTGRADLASLFGDLAMRLNKDLKMPNEN